MFEEFAEASRSEDLMRADTVSTETNHSDPTNADSRNIDTDADSRHLGTDADSRNLGAGDGSTIDKPHADVHIMPARDGQRDTIVTPQLEMIPLSPRVEL